MTKSWKILKVLESFGTKISKTWSPKFSFPNLVFPRLFFPRHGSLPNYRQSVVFLVVDKLIVDKTLTGLLEPSSETDFDDVS